uniref:Uncharacterized protein n=1 Tax=Amphimedon queenslandica TaxID=400682 RepID=A0A1X7TD98_AMPQE
ERDTALIVSARGGDYETVKVLLDNGADPNIGLESEYLAPLIEAAREGHINVVELLLSKGADPNCIDQEGDTALIVSARGGDYETVKVLLDNGADPNIEMDPYYVGGTTALMAAVNNKHHHVVELLLTKITHLSLMYNEGDIALIVSARGGDYETVKVLLDNGADPNIHLKQKYVST